MKKIIYTIKYKYYQYNSGQADNGTYWNKIELEDIEKAKTLYNKIKDCIEKKLSDEEVSSLVDDYIPYAGFFQEVKFFKSVEEEYSFESTDKINNEFLNCPHCYSEKEGYSEGCKICDNTGTRIVTKDSVELAVSSKEWLDAKVGNLWGKYNRIFNLKYSLSSWSFYEDYIYIVAGYSSRGSVFEESFELSKEWLWNTNIEPVMLELKSIQDKEKANEENQLNIEKLESLKKQIATLEEKTK